MVKIMKVSEYNNIPHMLTNRWESGVGELVNQMGLQNVLVISNVEDELNHHIYYASVTRTGTGFTRLPYKDNQFDCVILMYAARIDDRLDYRLHEMNRVCREGKYIFIVDTVQSPGGAAGIICNKWVKESRASYGKREKELVDPAGIKAAMENAGLVRPYMRKLFLGTCNVFTATKKYTPKQA